MSREIVVFVVLLMAFPFASFTSELFREFASFFRCGGRRADSFCHNQREEEKFGNFTTET